MDSMGSQRSLRQDRIGFFWGKKSKCASIRPAQQQQKVKRDIHGRQHTTLPKGPFEKINWLEGKLCSDRGANRMTLSLFLSLVGNQPTKLCRQRSDADCMLREVALKITRTRF